MARRLFGNFVVGTADGKAGWHYSELAEKWVGRTNGELAGRMVGWQNES
jgi:hypothetical protein